MSHRIVAFLLLWGFCGVAHAEHPSWLNDADWRGYFPKRGEASLLKLRGQVHFYDEETHPPAYQNWVVNRGFHSPRYNISASQHERGIKHEPFGNANVEFPWGTTAGMARVGRGAVLKFVYLNGPITYHWTKRLVLDNPAQDPGMSEWVYAPGTVFGEILLVKDAKDGYKPFEVRTRTKRPNGTWRMNAYRPVRTAQELEEQLQAWGLPGEVQKLRKRPRPAYYALEDANHDRPGFIQKALVDELPELEPATVDRLLDLPFRSVLNTPWVDVDGREGYAPTVRSGYSIVPPQYEGAYVEVSQKSCMRCHAQVQQSASVLQSTVAPGVLRDWYGRVRGADGIFSFHIVDRRSISYNGSAQEPVFDRKLVDSGYLLPGRP